MSGYRIGPHGLLRGQSLSRERRRPDNSCQAASSVTPRASRANQMAWSGDKFPRGISYAGGLVAIGVIYFALAKGGLALASIHPSATPIWPPTGVALAAVLLWGYRTWPAIFTAAVIANATTAGSVATAIAIATGKSLEEVVGAYLIYRWSSGCNTFSASNSLVK